MFNTSITIIIIIIIVNIIIIIFQQIVAGDSWGQVGLFNVYMF